ncbi:hypothetical protein NLJ89_g196 [Agrocybe chaxingu]|uniref:Uncharacterized protein n=1 Tax=Agrocybe chaxingu TaxID=84603 RepID=A0A9W8N2G0_9AGAR|nr:hypothetical protein NLJ89_g196 [Agrocybe chaxingu]
MNLSGETVFPSGKDTKSSLKKLETDDVKVQELNFQALSTAPATAAPASKYVAKEKEDVKIECVLQIALKWCTNVLTKVDILDYYSISGCYILKPQPETQSVKQRQGHSIHLAKAQAYIKVQQILEPYRQVYEDLFAVLAIPGTKSEKEKFAGGLYTTTLEGYIPTSGCDIQVVTSHV